MTQPPRHGASPGASTPPADDAGATDPALALGDVWDLLDVLPAAVASPDMMATTMEMAAVTSGGHLSGTGRVGRSAAAAAWPPARQWLPGAAIVLASLVAGIALGRATAPNPESAMLASLPVVQHLDLLREAGSVGFLEAVAKGGYPPPRRPPPAQSKAAAREDAEEFDAAIAALRATGGVTADRATLAARREQVLRMPDEEKRQLERSANRYQRLTGADRSELAAVGRALADPERRQILEAARIWHMWVQLRDPADRRDVIELSAEDRLEWLDRWTRIDSRQDGRDGMRPFFDRDWENRRRPPQDFRQGPPPDHRPGPPGPPEFWRDDRPPGPPRPRGPGGRGGPGPMRGPEADRDGPDRGEPPVNDRATPPPAETPAPLR